MKFRAFAVVAVALATLGGCATYDYSAGSAPGGYYSGRPQVEYYGGYGYPYGSYGGFGYGYYGYPYGGYAYPYGGYGHYPPYYYGQHYPGYPSHPRPRPENGGSQPQPRPPGEQYPQDGRAPWRNLRRIVEENNRTRQVAPRTSPVPQANTTPRMAPMPRPQATPMPRMRSEGGNYRRSPKAQSEER